MQLKRSALAHAHSMNDTCACMAGMQQTSAFVHCAQGADLPAGHDLFCCGRNPASALQGRGRVPPRARNNQVAGAHMVLAQVYSYLDNARCKPTSPGDRTFLVVGAS